MYRVLYDMAEEHLPDPNAAREFLAKRPMRIAPHGGRANAYWFGPADGPDTLRLDIDYDAGRAALTWLPDNTHAIELDPNGPIVVLESSDYDVVTIPAELARVSPDTAHRAVIEYVTSGRRPTCVEWTT